MHRKILVVASMLCFAAAAWSQAAVGVVSNVSGVVTTTVGTTGGTAAAGGPILDGMRFVTGSTGSATLTMNSGCVVSLGPNQTVTVLSTMTCEQILAAVSPVTGAGAVAGAGGVYDPLIGMGGAFAVGVILMDKVSGD